MFKRVQRPTENAIEVEIDGEKVRCYPGDTVAAVVMLKYPSAYRHTVITNSPRMPFCMMGVCFECLVEIDGVPNQQGCVRTVTPGMKIARRLGVQPMTAKAEGEDQ
ncbi:(2Fe-2S)-binding protein [Pantoea ananatis]|uniref:(2Fe-2S)-binding protein n=1 Tax=Pantoea ananas TaxID=553 RepID=UPI00119ED417|nr:(2Fe-2S)-binding protein [Pantoea ananatis]